MRLVAQYTSAPVPKVIFSNYRPGEGSIGMSFIPGQQLDCLWDKLDEHTKELVCHETWGMISRWRKIPRPPSLSQFYQCLADGSHTTEDALLKSLEDPPKLFTMMRRSENVFINVISTTPANDTRILCPACFLALK